MVCTSNVAGGMSAREKGIKYVSRVLLAGLRCNALCLLCFVTSFDEWQYGRLCIPEPLPLARASGLLVSGTPSALAVVPRQAYTPCHEHDLPARSGGHQRPRRLVCRLRSTSVRPLPRGCLPPAPEAGPHLWRPGPCPNYRGRGH